MTIEIIPDLPENVVGFSIIGKVTSEDYKTVLIPAVEASLKKHDKIRALGHFGPKFEGYSGAAAFDDAKFGLSHWTAWEKIAIVSDVEWLRFSANSFGFLMPGAVKIFSNSEFDDAKSWVAA